MMAPKWQILAPNVEEAKKKVLSELKKNLVFIC